MKATVGVYLEEDGAVLASDALRDLLEDLVGDVLRVKLDER